MKAAINIRTFESKLIRSGYYFAVLVIAYCILGTVGNLLHIYLREVGSRTALLSFWLAHTAVLLTIIWSAVRTVTKYNWKAADWGFTLRWGCWISLGLIALDVLYKWQDWHTFKIAQYFWDPQQIVSITIEELVFRVAAISFLMHRFRNHKGRAILSIVLAAPFFIVPHLPTDTAHHLVHTILAMSLFFGVVFYYTRSILFPMYWHVMQNRGDILGLTGTAAVLVLYFGIAILGWYLDRRRRLKPVGGEAL